jgi:hypothetical protein
VSAPAAPGAAGRQTPRIDHCRSAIDRADGITGFAVLPGEMFRSTGGRPIGGIRQCPSIFWLHTEYGNAAFQSCPVHTGPGSATGHRHVKPKNRSMEKIPWRWGVTVSPSNVSTPAKSQIYNGNAFGLYYRYYLFD